MTSSTQQPQPQEIDYQDLERIWGQEINQVPAPVRDIIAGVLRKVREDSPPDSSPDYLHCSYPFPAIFTQFPII